MLDSPAIHPSPPPAYHIVGEKFIKPGIYHEFRIFPFYGLYQCPGMPHPFLKDGSPSTHIHANPVVHKIEGLLNQADSQFQACLTGFYQKAYNLLDISAGVKITIGVGAAYPEISSFGRSYKDATDALYYRILAGCGQILFWEKPRQFPICPRKKKKHTSINSEKPWNPSILQISWPP